MKIYRLWQIAVTVLIAACCVLACLLTKRTQIGKELSSLEGWLHPANENVEIDCFKQIGLKKNSVVLIAGTNTYLADVFPALVLDINCDNVIMLDRDIHGNIALTMSIKDRDGRVIVALDRGKFTVNRNNYFKIDRPQPTPMSTLSVLNEYGDQVLYLHLANDHTLKMSVALNYRGKQIAINDDTPFPPGFSNGCTALPVGAIQIGKCLAR